jgi:hypothetical protein
MYFPITCVDDFYNDPDKVREFALSLDYQKKSQFNYPGERTPLLHTVDKEFFDKFCYKIFSVFFNLEYDSLSWNVQTLFQKIYQYDSPEDIFKEVNSGWTHKDDGMAFAGVIYLNPNPNLDSGTTICDSIDKENPIDGNNYDWSVRNNFYNRTGLDVHEYAKLKDQHNSKFNTTLEFKNVYNRMICYDSHYWHKESGFAMDSEDFRLTQVFFVNYVDITSPSAAPYSRCKHYDL